MDKQKGSQRLPVTLKPRLVGIKSQQQEASGTSTLYATCSAKIPAIMRRQESHCLLSADCLSLLSFDSSSSRGKINYQEFLERGHIFPKNLTALPSE